MACVTIIGGLHRFRLGLTNMIQEEQRLTVEKNNWMNKLTSVYQTIINRD